MTLLFETSSLVLGLVHGWASRVIPFREQSGPAEVGWDIFAMLFGIACGSLYAVWIGIPLELALFEAPALAGWHEFVATMPWLAVAFANLLFADFVAYWTHRWLHGKWLWNSHAWHHASRHLWWLSGLRASPVQLVLALIPYSLGNALFAPQDRVMLIAVVILGIANQHWIHSNIYVPYPRIIEWVFVTPRFHFVHHSADVRFTDTNYAFLFTFWDKLFGTYTAPEQVPADELLGLEYKNSHWRYMLGIPPRERICSLPERSAPALQAVAHAPAVCGPSVRRWSTGQG